MNGRDASEIPIARPLGRRIHLMTSHTHEPHDPATEAIGPSAPSEVLDASPRGRRRYLWAAIGVLALIVGGMYLSRQFGDPGPNEGATDRPDRVLEALNCKPGARYVDLAGAPRTCRRTRSRPERVRPSHGHASPPSR